MLSYFFSLLIFLGSIISFCFSFQSVRAEDDDEFVVLQKPIQEIRQAFNEMRGQHSEMFVNDRSWAIQQLILGKVAAIFSHSCSYFWASCSIFWADLQLISYD